MAPKKGKGNGGGNEPEGPAEPQPHGAGEQAEEPLPQEGDNPFAPQAGTAGTAAGTESEEAADEQS